ncbi:heavy-metal-associated domain-containing protein [Riemerella columbina]|uniref:heavy-metal-associated domain-containing protein n=1 Tax=Riemerella columbina TaxID=103810 RepID=UPI00266F6EB5|nr:heavy-metal-associated domain-containing protein [Riemerella columbina]WKS94514.1 heavy-metal-associated domain-containing protein [Riemerella columbina]
MENQEFKFKTNINCSGCVSSVKPHLDGEANISEWHVDTDNKDKILTVKAKNLTPEQISEVVKKAGFKAETVA